MRIPKIKAAMVLSLILAGCASIVGDRTQLIPISSSPDEADIVIADETGMNVFKGKTPTTVTLQKSDGSYWGKKNYIVKISRAGFQTQTIPIKASANGWYIAGNLIFGGLIGWFIVDPLNGAMYTLSPDQVRAELGGASAWHNNADRNQIAIVLLPDVPQSLQEKMIRIDQGTW